ncbi:hypothetical protein Tco_1140412 [Tanacetum coccineum]
MTGVREHFKELDEKVSGKVKFGDGSYIEIKGKGSIIIECDDDKQRIITVYYIPDLKSNLLSLGQFTEIGCKVVMEDDELRLYDMNNKIFMKVARQRNRLYKANLRIAGAVRHAIHILNSVPTKALEDITPYEAIKKRKPNLENLRIFGCHSHICKATHRICVSRDVKFKEDETWDWNEYISEHTDNEPEWTDFKIGDTKVTNEYHDQETEPTEDNDEFPNNNDDYSSPPRDSPLQHQTPHTSPRHSPKVISQVTPDTSRQSNYQGDHDSTKVINSPSQFDHTPVRGFSAKELTINQGT